MQEDSLPIGVFDSGLGGLTVLKALKERFPNENFIYLGDTARIPYGIKSSRTIALYLQQNLEFLNSLNIKAAVVACNSASTQIHTLNFNKPLYNVIEPGARIASELTKNGFIGVIATKATVANKSYVTAIEKRNSKIKVFQQAAPLLVPLVEEGWDDDPLTNLVIFRYISPLISAGIDTLILGCTHYPILKPAIMKVVGPNVTLVDSALAIAEQMDVDFKTGKLLARSSISAGDIRYLTTDVSDNFQAQAQRIMAPHPVRNLELVDIHF